jgi:hypothetical protein
MASAVLTVLAAAEARNLDADAEGLPGSRTGSEGMRRIGSKRDLDLASELFLREPGPSLDP